MKRFALSLTILFLTPNMMIAEEIACDIVAYVHDVTNNNEVMIGEEVYCFSVDECEGTTEYTQHGDGGAYFALHNWPNPEGCESNYGEYIVCLPYYWQQVTVEFDLDDSDGCHATSGCPVHFYVDPEDEKARWKCNTPSK